MSSAEALQQAQTEELTLLVAETKSGYFGVAYRPKQRKPFQAQVWRGGKTVSLGYFATAEEAALCVARSPKGQAVAAERAAEEAVPLTSEEARQQAQAEELTLVVAETKSGYFGVAYRPGKPKPYEAQVWRGGKAVSLGYFATAEEAALCVARSPEGQAAAAAAEKEEEAEEEEVDDDEEEKEQDDEKEEKGEEEEEEEDNDDDDEDETPMTSQEALQQVRAEGLKLTLTPALVL